MLDTDTGLSSTPRVVLDILVLVFVVSLVACATRDTPRAESSTPSKPSGIEVAASNAPDDASDEADERELAAAGITPEKIEAKSRDGSTFEGESENVVGEIRNRGEFMNYVCNRLPPEQRDAVIEEQFRRGYAVFCGPKVGPKALQPK